MRSATPRSPAHANLRSTGKRQKCVLYPGTLVSFLPCAGRAEAQEWKERLDASLKITHTTSDRLRVREAGIVMIVPHEGIVASAGVSKALTVKGTASDGPKTVALGQTAAQLGSRRWAGRPTYAVSVNAENVT